METNVSPVPKSHSPSPREVNTPPLAYSPTLPNYTIVNDNYKPSLQNNNKSIIEVSSSSASSDSGSSRRSSPRSPIATRSHSAPASQKSMLPLFDGEKQTKSNQEKIKLTKQKKQKHQDTSTQTPVMKSVQDLIRHDSIGNPEEFTYVV